MEHIFLPVDNVNDFACYSVLDKDTIRAYRTMPAIDSSSNYVDFYINSHYLQKEGSQSWGQWQSYLPTCISNSSITNDIYYRNDLDSILLIFLCIVVFVTYFPRKIINVFYKRGFNL